MTSDQDIARRAIRFQNEAKEYRLFDLPGYSQWSKGKLDAGESESLIANLDSVTMTLLPEDVRSVGRADYEEMLEELKRELQIFEENE